MNQIRSIPGITEATKHWGREHRKARHIANALDVDEFDDDLDLDDIFAPTGNHAPVAQRASDRYILHGEALQLDAMLERHGLRAILATLRSLCDSRIAADMDESGDLDSMLGSEEESDDWRAAADQLESVIATGKVNPIERASE